MKKKKILKALMALHEHCERQGFCQGTKTVSGPGEPECKYRFMCPYTHTVDSVPENWRYLEDLEGIYENEKDS